MHLLARDHDDPAAPDTGSGSPPIVKIGAYEQTLYGEYDLDGNTALGGFPSLADSVQGPAASLEPQCVCMDMDIDGEVDLADFAAFLVRIHRAGYALNGSILD